MKKKVQNDTKLDKEQDDGLKADERPREPQPLDTMFIAEVANALERSQIDKFHWGGGTGFAAEDANIFNDRINLRNVDVTGTDNIPNGPDRIVDGIKIQTKYFSTPSATVGNAFDPTTGDYRYTNQLLEVPMDQWEECVAIMREKILEGRVEGVDNPKEAKRIVKRGSVTYKQARNIARAGNIDSLVYDVKTQSITSSYIFAISFGIEYARRRWNGEESDMAAMASLGSAIKAGSTNLITGVITSQLLRTRIAALGTVAMRDGVKLAATTNIGKNTIHHIAAFSLRKGVYGAAAVNHVSRVLRTNFIAGAVSTVVLAAPDFYRASVKKNISWKQFYKNLFISVAGVAGGLGGAVGGAAIGGSLGTVVPIIGNIAGAITGGIVGALVGSTALTKGAKVGLDSLVEDDAKTMLKLIEGVVGTLAFEYIFSNNEITLLSDKLKDRFDAKWLRSLYALGTDETREKFVYKELDTYCLDIAKRRDVITLPDLNKLANTIDSKHESL